MFSKSKEERRDIISEKLRKFINLRDRLMTKVSKELYQSVREQLLEWTLRLLKELKMDSEMTENIILLTDLLAM